MTNMEFLPSYDGMSAVKGLHQVLRRHAVGSEGWLRVSRGGDG